MSTPVSADTQRALMQQTLDNLVTSQAEHLVETRRQADELHKLSDQWNRATGVVNFMKWVVGLLAAGGGLLAAFKLHFLGISTP